MTFPGLYVSQVDSLDNYEAESQRRVLHFAANLELGCANIGHNDSSTRKLARQSEASTADSAVGTASDFVGRLDDFAAFAPDYKPDLISTDKSRTSTCCIGGGAATTCEVTEKAASRKVNVVFSSESSVLINDPIADNDSWPIRFTGGFSCQGQSQDD